MMYLWNLLDKQQLFSINCKGWNRHISFGLSPSALSKFFISFTNKTTLTLYYSCNTSPSISNSSVTLRSAFFQREILCALPLYNKYTGKLSLLMGGEDTEMMLGDVKKDQIDLIQSFNHHTSSIRSIIQLEGNGMNMLVSAGGRMVVNLYQLNQSESGNEVIHLCKYEGLTKSDQDFRIMAVDGLYLQDHVVLFIASSSGQYHCIACKHTDYKFSLISTLKFDTALLCIKMVEVKENGDVVV